MLDCSSTHVEEHLVAALQQHEDNADLGAINDRESKLRV
jgi:hypothetical protein